MEELAKEYDGPRNSTFLTETSNTSQTQIKDKLSEMVLLPGLSLEAKVPLILFCYLAVTFFEVNDLDLQRCRTVFWQLISSLGRRPG
jgi:hypothetical protein